MKPKLFDYILVIIQSILSIWLVTVVRLLVPDELFLPFIGLLVILVLIVAIMLLGLKKWIWFNRILSILISAFLFGAAYTANKGISTIEDISNVEEELNTYSIVVLADSDYQVVKDLDNLDIGICNLTNKEEYEELKNNIEAYIEYREVGYNSVDEMQSALFDHEVEAILLNESYRPIIEEINEDFTNDTRVISEYTIQASNTTEILNPIEEEETKTEVEEEEEVVLENTSTKRAVDVTKEGFSIYITGIDTYGPINARSRSDVNLIMTVNPNSHTIVLTSIPRDYHVTLASFGAKDKLTHSGLYGANETVRTVENLFGININYYVRVNFTSLLTIVDALGGITINNPHAGFMSLPVGAVTINSKQALTYARERYSFAAGDHQRILNQQIVLQGILNKAMSPAIIYNYGNVLNAISGSFETNMTSNEIQSLIQMQISSMSGWNFISQAVSGTGTTSTTCYSYRGPALYVCTPDMNTVANAAAVIRSYSY